MKIISELVEILKEADDAYFNNDEPIISDHEYDSLKKQLQNIDPANEYLIGIGSSVRGNAVKLPTKMPSLDQLYTNDDINNWLINDINYIISSKMDGISVLLVYNSSGDFQIAYTRGDGYEGADITRHIIKTNLPKSLENHTNNTVMIRGEIIISKPNFKKFNEDCVSNNHKQYKNPRNAVAGIVNAKEKPDWMFKYIDIFVYEVIGFDFDKLDQLSFMENNNLLTVNYIQKQKINDDILDEIITNNKKDYFYGDYEQDGVVIDIDSAIIREELNDLDDMNPKYSKKYKVREESNIALATVKEVHWNISKNGLLKPRIEIEPIDLVGVTITYVTGFNAKFINDNKIGPNTVIELTRSGDVIPHILQVIKHTNPQLPCIEKFGDYSWNDTNVDLVISNMETTEVIIKSLTSFFDKLDVIGLKEKSVEKFVNNGYDNIPSIIKMSEDEMVAILGKNGSKVYQSLRNNLSSINEALFFGSLPIFGGGVGRRLVKKVYDQYGKFLELSQSEIEKVEGFDCINAEKVYNALIEYENILKEIDGYYTFEEPELFDGKLNGCKFIFTGYRSKDAEQQIISLGGEIVSTVKKSTHVVTKDVNGNTSKLKQARSLDKMILSPNDLEKLIEN